MSNPWCAHHRADLPPAETGTLVDLTHSIDGTLVFNRLCGAKDKPKGLTRSMTVRAFPALQVVVLTHGVTCECKGQGETVLPYAEILECERERARLNRCKPQRGTLIRPAEEIITAESTTQAE